MQLKYLNSIRTHELDIVINLLEKQINKTKQDIKILEVGSGTGWQAKKLKELGYQVEAIDLENSNYANNRVFDITNYDGITIPFKDETFDVIFSSNVLEHVPHIEKFQYEIQRVLKSDGIAIHVLPSGTWSLWSNMTYYLDKLKKIIKKVSSLKTIDKNNSIQTKDYENRSKRTYLQMMLPSRHGERGNAFSEIYYFSKMFWYKSFIKADWSIVQVTNNNLLYTGNSFFSSILSISSRKILSNIFGASCNIFILKKINT